MARMPDTLPTQRAPRMQGARMPARDVSSGIGAVAEVLDGIAQTEMARRQRAQEQDDALALSNAVARFRADQTAQLMTDGDALSDDAIDGFSERFASNLDSDVEKRVAGLPERVRNQARAAFTETRESLRVRALDVEHGRRVDRQGRLLDDTMQNYRAAVFHDATQYGEVLERGLAEIGSSGLPAAAQERARNELPGVLARDRLLGLVETNPGLGLREINNGEWNEELDVQELARFRNSLQAEIDRRRAEAERQAAAARARLGAGLRIRMEDDIASIGATGRGVGVTLNEIEAVFGAEAATAYAAQRRSAEQNHTLVSRWRFASPDDIRTDLAAAAPRAGQAGFAVAQERHQALTRLASGVIEQRATDPAQAALLADPALAQLWEGLADQQTDARGRRVIVAQMRDRQTRLGIPAAQQRLTTNAQAQSYAARIRGADAGGRAQTLADVADEIEAVYGASGARALAEIASAAELPELAGVAAINHAEPRRRAQMRRSAATALSSPEPELTAAQTRQLNQALNSRFSPLRETLASTPDGLTRLEGAYATARRMAMADVAAGVSPPEAAERAAAAYVSSYQYRAGLRIPRQWSGNSVDPGRVIAGADAMRRRIGDAGDFVLPAGRADAASEDQQRAARDAFYMQSRWQSLGNDEGLELVDGFGWSIASRDGAPIRASWSDLLAADAERREDNVQGFARRTVEALTGGDE